MLTAGPTLKTDVTVGNVISWAVMVLTAGLLYGVLRTTVENNTKNNERQDIAINALATTLNTLQITNADSNAELRTLRETLTRIEKQQNDEWQAQLDQWRQERQRDQDGHGK